MTKKRFNSTGAEVGWMSQAPIVARDVIGWS